MRSNSNFLFDVTRKLFLSMMLMGSGVFFGLWAMGVASEINPVTRFALPFMGCLLLCTSVLMMTQPQRQTLWVKIAVVALAFLLPNLAFSGILLQPFMREIHFIAPVVLWMPLTFMVVFFAFETRAAMAWCAGMFVVNVLALCVPVFGFLPSHVAHDSGRLVITALISQPVYMAVLLAFAAIKARHAHTEVETQAMRIAAETDGLTGILNRRRAQEDIKQALIKQHQKQQPLGLIMLDADHFKCINDQYGHTTGDAVLMQIAQLLRHKLGPQQFVARWGGEEFMIWTTAGDAAQLHGLAQQLCQDIANAAWPNNLPVTVSIGTAWASTQDTELSIINRADTALYEAKRLGRNQVVNAPTP